MQVPKVTMKYYLIDLEVLFSHHPFLEENTDDFSHIQPNNSEVIELNNMMREQKVKILEEYCNKNLVIEVNGSGIQRFVTYFSTTMRVKIFENYGELKATDEKNNPLPNVYVKAFTMNNSGAVSFYKDGYTDIRGRFDYVSLNSSALAEVEKFALFVMSAKHGSLTKECLPPSTTFKPIDELGPMKAKLGTYYTTN